MFRWCAVVVLGIVALAARGAAQDRWSDPYPGVRHLSRTLSTPNRVDALVVDLCAAGISLRATASSERMQTVPSYASATGVEAAINGDFFSYTDYSVGGLAVHAGRPWADSPDTTGAGTIAFGHDRSYFAPPREVIDPVPAWLLESVGGHPLILRDGAVVDDTSALCTARHPRTAVGFSADRRTLIMFVVDGRSSASAGMTCAEEARQLEGLGASDGLNLDGGGSSTMWIRGDGVVNVPSDGAPRVVANHLGLNATGAGMPTSCNPLDPEETVFLAAAVEDGSTTDLDGDGRADVCARAGAGIQCHLSNGAGFGDVITGPTWSDMSGWADEDNWSTIRMGDVNGDGLADLCARANADYRCLASTGTGFAAAAMLIPDLADANGWDQPSQYGTIRLADVNGDGMDDVCGRDPTGFHCWPSTGDAFGPPMDLPAMSDAAGWEALGRWGSIRMGDVDGDGMADVCGRGMDGLDCWRSTGTGFDATPIAGPRWDDAGGWNAHRFFATIRVVDVDGDGLADVCARTGMDFRCQISTGDGFGAPVIGPMLSDASGWGEPNNYETLRFADIDGDGDRDLCGRANAGVRCWTWDGAGFAAMALDGPDLSDMGSWDFLDYNRSIRFGDVDGDGRADLCARANARFYCWISTGTAFPTRVDGPVWSNMGNWWRPQYHATIRLAGPPPVRTPPEVDAGVPVETDGGVGPGEDAGPIARRDAGGGGGDRDAGTPERTVAEGGCGCSTPAAGAFPGGMLWMLAIGWLLHRRRR